MAKYDFAPIEFPAYDEACWTDLDAPVKRVAGLDTAFPFAGALEEQFLASHRLHDALQDLLTA